ncbi:RNA polymerase sigma factor SigJ [Streptomyces sp. NPDC058001]|uniref:RNA polymerase sigma factor SigJ n=1 Tax=Streptomyces sp. NPDC058001 TaxID=3346300 RepID=UPI0036EE4FA1
MAELSLFEQQSDRLWGIAYRITGSVADADDAVQETWLRWQGLPDGDVIDPRAYLTTVISRICYDQLGSARARRESYIGPWLPEPVLTDAGPEDRVTLDESVGMAMLTVLERLTPAERTAFILHDVFAVPFPEIAEVVGRTPDAVRQLASRARRHVRAEAPRRSVDPDEHRRAVEAFLAAVMGGDLEALLEILHPDVVWRSDGGGKVTAARLPVVGQDKVARFVQGLLRSFDLATVRLAVHEVNGATGVVLSAPAGSLPGGAVGARGMVFAFTVDGGRIAEINAVINPDKLRHLDFGGGTGV